MQSFRLNFQTLIAVLLFVLLSACGGLDGGGADGGGHGSGSSTDMGGGIGGTGDGDGGGGEATEGQLQIVVSGSDAPGFESLRVGVSSVEVHDADPESAESAWVPLPLEESELDVVQLIDGRMSVLADALLPVGSYDGIRVQFSDSSADVLGLRYEMMLVGTGEAELETGAPIVVGAGAVEVIELDFDSVRSIQVLGQDDFKLRPELSVVNPSVLGTITGTVTPLGIGAEVRAYQEPNGALVAAASVRADGSFTLPRLSVYASSGAPAEYRILAAAPGHVTSEPYSPLDLLPHYTMGGLAFSLRSADGNSPPSSGGYYYWWEESGNSGDTSGGGNHGGGNGKP